MFLGKHRINPGSKEVRRMLAIANGRNGMFVGVGHQSGDVPCSVATMIRDASGLPCQFHTCMATARVDELSQAGRARS